MNLTNIRVYNPLRYNAKKQQLNKEKQQSIHFKNLNLLRKIQDIQQRKPKIRSPFSKDSLNMSIRVRDCQRINRQNKIMALRLQSQQSNYSQYMCKPTDHKRCSTSMSVPRRKISISLSVNSQNRNRTQYDEQEGIRSKQDGFQSRTIICQQPIQISGKLFHLEFSQSSPLFFITLQGYANSKKYKMRLTQSAGDYLVELVQTYKFNFSRRIFYSKGVYILKIPLKGFMRTYSFIEFKQTASKGQRKLVFKKSHQQITNELLQSISSDSVSASHLFLEDQKQVVMSDMQSKSHQEMLSQSDHSYMYENDH